jgi:hypothetical protein
MKTTMFASYLLSVKPLAVAAPQSSVTKPPRRRQMQLHLNQLVQLFVSEYRTVRLTIGHRRRKR